MASIEFLDIAPETLPLVQQLLAERNGTLPAYVEWKYGKNSPSGFRGIVAVQGKNPLGCFGLMPKMLQAGDELISCGWFADWYVTPATRGGGLGAQLLREITKKGYSFFFGHPGPKKASAICIKNGWQPIPFQSARRLIMDPASYYGHRTHYFPKQIFQMAWHFLRVIVGKFSPVFPANENAPALASEDSNWLFAQPFHPQVKRAYGNWRRSGLQISYCDDALPSGELRRRVLWIENIRAAPREIPHFFDETKKSGITYMDIFTTDPFTDAILARAGAVRFYESPVVWYGVASHCRSAFIQGGDRENWLYLAGELG